MADNFSEDVLYAKAALRLAMLPQTGVPKVLDCYAGMHEVWNLVESLRECDVTHSDRKPRVKGDIKADAVKIIAGADLGYYDLVDLDAYGAIYKEVKLLMSRGFTGAITFTQVTMSMYPNMAHEALVAQGIPYDWIKEAPSILINDSPQKLLNNALFVYGVEKYSYFAVDLESRKMSHIYGAINGPENLIELYTDWWELLKRGHNERYKDKMG